MDYSEILNKPALIGREKELKQLKEMLESMLSGHGGLVFISGEAGIGKTRLIFELRDYALPLGVRFLTGRSLYHEGSDPYLPFIDALREYFKREKHEEAKGDEKISGPIGFIGHVGGLEKMESRSEGAIPLGLLTTMGHDESQKREEIDIRKERDRMFETVLQLIISISKEKPLILFLDDLQWADSASLQLLYYISRNIRETRVLICCTYRPEDLLESEGKAHPLTDTIKRMSRERLFATINLKRLNYEETKKMTQSLLRRDDIPKPLTDLIYDKTEGNPFFVEEVVKSLIEEGMINTKDKGWAEKLDLSNAKVPMTIKDVITRRIDRLDEDSIKALEIAATIGREFTFDVLQKATEMNEETLLDSLDALIAAKLIREESGENEEKYRFDHTSIREVVYNSLSRGKRRMLHRKVGQALELLKKEKLSEVVYNLAYHFSQGMDYERAAQYSMKAGDKAFKSYAPNEALQYYKMAIDALDKLEESIEQKEQKLLILNNMGKICYYSTAWQDGIEYYKQMLALADELKNNLMRAEAYRSMGHIYREKNEWEDAKTNLETAIKISEEIKDQHGLGDAIRGRGWIEWRLGNLEKAIEYFKDALSNAEGAGDNRVIASCYIDLGNVYGDKGEFEKAIEYYSKSEKLLEAQGDYFELARVYNNVGETYKEQGMLEKAVEYYEKCIQTSEKSKNMILLAFGYQNCAEVYARMDKLDNAKEYADKAMVLGKRIEDKFLIAGVLGVYGIISRKKKDWENAEKSFSEAISILDEINVPYYIAEKSQEMAYMFKDKGDKESSIFYFRKALEIYKKLGAVGMIEKVNAQLEILNKM